MSHRPSQQAVLEVMQHTEVAAWILDRQQQRFIAEWPRSAFLQSCSRVSVNSPLCISLSPITWSEPLVTPWGVFQSDSRQISVSVRVGEGRLILWASGAVFGMATLGPNISDSLPRHRLISRHHSHSEDRYTTWHRA